MTLNRRNLLLGAASLGVCGVNGARGAPILTDDGLYKEPWFLESFLELADDLDGAHKEGKRFAIMWELKGCPYCKETHFVNFARPDIADYIKANFEVLQLNIIGSRKVTDFDGERIVGKGAGREIWRALHADLPVFPGTGRPAQGAGARQTRSGAPAGLYAAGRFSRHVPLRPRKSL